MLEKEDKYYEEHKKELLEKYKDRFIVIVNQKVISDYSSREEALSKTVEIYELGKFLIQKVTDQEEEIIQRFHSRVYV